MENLLYSTYELALIIHHYKMNPISYTEFLSNVYHYDNAFIENKYRRNLKRFMLDVMDMLNYVNQAETYFDDIDEIEQDLLDFGLSENGIECDITDFSENSLFFKDMRLKLLYIESKGYTRLKLRTLLARFGYKKRTQALINYILDCLLFYHIDISLRDNMQCDLNEIFLDDMIIFRVV